MPQVRWLLYRLRSLWRRDAREADLEAELQFHIEAEAEEHIEAGLPADRARQAALRALGNVTSGQRRCACRLDLGRESSASSRMSAMPFACSPGNGRSPRPRSRPSS